jgi:hypothetical protein
MMFFWVVTPCRLKGSLHVSLHGVTTHKNSTVIFSAMRASHLTNACIVFFYNVWYG